MIRRLTLLRHAEALPIADGQEDAERGLTPHGLLQCAALAGYLGGRAFSTMVISPSLRTRQTASRALGASPQAETLPALYQASADQLAQITGSFSDDVVEAVIVAHNPGISVFANRLSRRAGEMTPCTAVSFLFDGRWIDRLMGSCRLDWRFNPEDR